MHRRQFMAAAVGGLAVSALGACVSQSSPSGAASVSSKAGPKKATDAAAWIADRKFMPMRFGQIAYVERGSGDAALFLHGFPLSSFQWRGAFDRLAGERRCVAADFLGLGFTQGRRRAELCAERADRDARGACSTRFRSRQVDLIANDSGGAVAQLFVLRYPQRVRTMLLTNCDVEPDSPPPALQPVLEAAREGKFAETWLAPSVANTALARTKDGLGGQTFTYPENPTDEAIEPVPRAAGELAGAQGADGCVRARARPEPARRHRGIAQAVHRADADSLGHGRQHLLGGEPGLSRSHCCRTRAACGVSRARSCSCRRSSRT